MAGSCGGQPASGAQSPPTPRPHPAWAVSSDTRFSVSPPVPDLQVVVGLAKRQEGKEDPTVD